MLTLSWLFREAVVVCQRYVSGPSHVARSIMHVKCRNAVYPRTDIKRFLVPDEKAPWSVSFPEYAPVKYTADSVLKGPVWADRDFEVEKQNKDIWNKVHPVMKIDRTSFSGCYEIVNDLPRNPVGRTGMTGRGLLGRWGPNHAADPIVTRWKRNETGDKATDGVTKKPILQFVSIQRKDSGEWAIPGGMVDPGELITTTLKREFSEEAMNSLENTEEGRRGNEKKIDEFFAKHTEVYSGYVDDPRNTDNAWMETVAYNFHDETGEFVGKFHMHAGDDAVGVKWMDIDRNLQLYASHSSFIERVVQRLKAHW